RGEPVSVTVEAEDRVGGVRNVTLDVSGETTWSDLRQVTPPELSTTEVFTFNVSESATIGGDIHLDARAEDTGGQLSSVHRVTLRVVDTVAPAAETTAPLPEAEFGPGETVVVTITATDAVGVDRIRYATSGAVEFADSEDLLPATSPASATFEFVIPDEIEDPDVWVHGFARDAAGNEGEAPQVHVTVVNDVTPPATRVTAVSDPGAAASATVSYEVQAGLSDLDHVELYFRRDGIGTFNRYTDADHGNPRGLFHPAGNGTGNIAFDSTKMGGDGTYEFYSVGVDRAGNREPAPLDGEGHVVADRSQSFAAGTPWVVISTPTLIGAGDATYEDRNLRIAGTTVTVDGHHEFRNVELLGGAVLTHPETDLTKEYGLDVTAWSLSIDAASSIDVGGCGYLGGGREGNDCTGQTLGNVDGSEYRAGGSYGGPGGTTSGTPAPVYGLITDPVDLGSGGGCSDYGYKGGDGGGRVLLHAINVASDGRIGANGANGTG
ncbi:MAG: hypothetical protein KBD01_17410, partial [Acidobacteria bacterium]|nr:hypothetical protein [Acidobacteriota bacterium]